MKDKFFKGIFSFKSKNPRSNERNELNEISGKPKNRQERRALKGIDRLLNQSKIDIEKHTFYLDRNLTDDTEAR